MEIQFLTVEMELLVNTDVRDGFGTTRIVNWAGCVIQDPHPAVRALRFLPRKVTGSMWQGGARVILSIYICIAVDRGGEWKTNTGLAYIYRSN